MMRSCRLLAALSLAAFASPAFSADLRDIQKVGALRVLVVDGSPAFYNLHPETGAPGLDREILEGFARLHKLALVTVEVPSFAVLVPWILEGKGDLIAGSVTVTPVRSQKIDFCAEVMPTRNVVVTRRPSRVIEKLSQLREERIGTVRGSSMAEALTVAGIKGFDENIASGMALDAMRAGKISATVAGVEDALLYRQEDPDVQIGMFIGPPSSLAYGVRKDAPQLKRALDDYVSNLRRTQTWSRLLVKTFGDAAPELLKRARAE